MLFGTGRLFQQLATPLGPPFGELGLTASTSLPSGSQVGDICIHHFTRNVTSEGSQPSGFSVIHRESLGAIGYVGWYAKVLTASDITAGAVTGGPTTNISSRWTYVTRPNSPVSSISTERLEIVDTMGTTFQKLTMAGTFTRPAIVMANAVTIGSTLNTKIDITPSVNKTIFNPAAFNSVAFDIVGSNDDNSARSTNQPTVTTESRYFMILVAITAN